MISSTPRLVASHEPSRTTKPRRSRGDGARQWGRGPPSRGPMKGAVVRSSEGERVKQTKNLDIWLQLFAQS